MGISLSTIKSAGNLFSKTKNYVTAYNKATVADLTSILQMKSQSLKGIKATELKLSPKIENDVVQLSNEISKKDEYFYHLTSKEKRDSMQKDGIVFIGQKCLQYAKALGKSSLIETRTVGTKCFNGMTYPGLKPLEHDVAVFSPKKTIAETFEHLMGRKLDLGTSKTAQVELQSSLLNQMGWNHVLDDLNSELLMAKGNLDFVSPELRNIIPQVDEAFKKVPPTIKDVICMRGEHYNPRNKKGMQRFLQFQNAKKGDVIGMNAENPSYAFFTDKLEYANHFANFQGQKKIIIKMCIPKGSKIPLTTYENGTAVLPRNSQYKVLDVKEDSGDEITALVEYVSK